MDSAPPDTPREVILVIDDEAPVRRVLVRALQHAGFDTIEAKDGSEAIHLFAEQARRISAVTLDLVMPTTNGRETLAMLSAYAPTLPIVVVTALPQPADLLGRVPGTKGVGYVHKPFTFDGLANEVRRVIAEMRDPTT